MWFLTGSFLLLLIFFGIIIWPFAPALVLGAIVSNAFFPLRNKMEKYLKSKNLSAILVTAIALVCLAAPLSWFFSHVTEQALDIYRVLSPKVTPFLETDLKFLPEKLQNSAIGKTIDGLLSNLPVKSGDLVEVAGTILQNISNFLLNQTTVIAKSVSLFTLHFFVGVFTTFFFLRDGDVLVKRVKALIPLNEQYTHLLFIRLNAMSRGIMYGVFGASLAQGVLGGLGFMLAGFENAIFWGFMIGIASIVPYIGASMIWIPASIFLFATGEIGWGIFMFIWGGFVISSIDNFVKPYIIGERASIHPLLSFLAILGGILVLGLPGIFIAPYLLSLALGFMEIYEIELAKLKSPSKPSTI